MAKDTEFKYTVHEHIGIIKESDKSDWTMELNLVGWGKNADDPEKAKYDIRSWNRSLEEPKMGKGVSLTREEAIALADILIENGLYSADLGNDDEDEDEDE